MLTSKPEKQELFEFCPGPLIFSFFFGVVYARNHEHAKNMQDDFGESLIFLFLCIPLAYRGKSLSTVNIKHTFATWHHNGSKNMLYKLIGYTIFYIAFC